MADKISWMTRWIVAAVFGSTSWVSPGWSQESVERVERDTTVYWVKTGDTVSDIAKRFLGDAANAPELLKYNNVSNPLEVTEGTLLAIPGRERDRALKLFDEARNALEQAIEAKSETFAADVFDKAMRSLRDAELAWNETSYLKAEGLCLLAIQYAGEAARLAAQRANVEQECRVTALQGSAEVMQKAEGHWEPIQEGAKVSVSSTLKTDAGSRAELTMPEGSKVQIGERSEVQIDGLLKDLRTDRMRIQLRLRLGEILNRVQPLRTKDSIFEIKSGESATAVRGTELRVKQEARGTSLIMTVAGEAITSTKRWAKAVRENFGILVDKKQRSRGPVKLLPPPTVQSPTPERFVTAAQTLNFRWDPVGGRVIVWFFKRPRTSYRLSGVTQYHLEIARDAAFNYVVESDHTADTHLTSKVLSPGDYYWRISSIDANRLEGKWSQSGQFCIRRDLVVNVATDVEPVEIDGRKLVKTGVAVPAAPVNTNTSVVQLEYSINGQPFRVFDKTPVLREAGEHRIQTRGVGADGEMGPMAQVSVTVDAEAPEVDIHIGRPTMTESGGKKIAVTITAEDDHGVKRIDTSLDGSEFTTYEGPLQLSASRTYALAIRAVDIVGNVSPTRIIKIESPVP